MCDTIFTFRLLRRTRSSMTVASRDAIDWVRCEKTARAAMASDLKELKKLRNAGEAWDIRVTTYAALRGNFKMVKWAVANGAPANANVYQWAQHHNDRAMMEWVYKMGLPTGL